VLVYTQYSVILVPTIDYLITKLEDLKQQQHHQPRSHFKASINLSWKKLNKYYLLSDETAAYRAAVVLHPHRKMAWFEKHWHEHHLSWITDAEEAVRDLFNSYTQRFERAEAQ